LVFWKRKIFPAKIFFSRQKITLAKESITLAKKVFPQQKGKKKDWTRWKATLNRNLKILKVNFELKFANFGKFGNFRKLLIYVTPNRNFLLF
jgi:hypothetical protein